MRFKTAILGLTWMLASWAGLAGGALRADDRPNVLIMIADDMTWSDLGYEGHPDIRTPNLDALAKQSLHLTQMFTPASTCSPSRNALYSGLYCIRSGAYPNHTRLFDGTKSVFSLLKDAGYRVALQNKTHVGPASSFPYEHIQGADNLEKTEAFIARDADQPWFLAYASNDPHSPWTRGPQEWYPPESLKLPAYLHDNAETRQALSKYYAEISQFDRQVGQLMELLEKTNQVDNTMVIFLSEQGSSLPYGGKWSLYDTGIRASTLVRWPGKVTAGTQSDALVQYVDIVPTVLEAAGIDPKTIDVGCPDALGNTGFDGRSFLAVLQGEQESFRDYVFSQHTTVGINGYLEAYPMRAVRDRRYKLIRNLAPENTYTIGGIHKQALLDSWKRDAANDASLKKRVDWLYKRPEIELYDLQEDPLETNNLAGQTAHAEVQQRLDEALTTWMAQQGDRGMETEELAHTRQGPNRQKKKQAGGKNGKKKAGAKPGQYPGGAAGRRQNKNGSPKPASPTHGDGKVNR